MASSSSNSTTRRWLNKVPAYASRFYFFLIFLQIPLFRNAVVRKPVHLLIFRNNLERTELFTNKFPGYLIPCRSGMCSTPMQVTSSQLIASEIFPVPVVKALLYPGAIVNGLVSNMTLPSWGDVLNIYNLTHAKEASPVADLQRLEVLAGSYFSVAGALIGILKPGRMSMFGTLLIIWGLVKEGILGKPANTDPTKAVFVYPTMLIAVVCAFSSVKYGANKIAKSAAARPIAQPLKSSKKSKLK